MNAELEAVLAEIRRADLPSFLDVPIDNAQARSVVFRETLLHVVAVWGDVDAARVLLDAGVPIDEPGEDGYTALLNAVEQGHAPLVRYLLERGADPYLKNDWGWDAFTYPRLTPEVEALLVAWKEQNEREAGA